MSISVTFLGAAQNVTGSRYLITTAKQKILVDCGLYQERDLRSRNWDAFPIPPAAIDCILLTHAHVDHCGYIPRLVQQGFAGKIYCTPATADIARIVLLDSAHLQEEDAAHKKERHKKEGRRGPYPVVPLYTTEDVQSALPLFEPIPNGTPFDLGQNSSAEFHEAGHILGSAMITLTTEKQRLLFSGDIGRWNKPILLDPTQFETADHVFVESTYGDRIHEDPQDIDTLLAETILSTRRAGGNVLIPSFAIGRTQEVLYHLNNLLLADRIPHLATFVDSPMAIRVTEVFRQHRELYDQEMHDLVTSHNSPFTGGSLHMATSTAQSKSINHIDGTAIIIAGSGMCTGGRIKHHLVRNIDRPESTLLFVGYQAVGTLGRIILDGAPKVRLFGKEKQVKFRIARIHGFSAHADQRELMHWLSPLKNPRTIIVTHGEQRSARALADLISGQFSCRVEVPAYGEELILE